MRSGSTLCYSLLVLFRSEERQLDPVCVGIGLLYGTVMWWVNQPWILERQLLKTRFVGYIQGTQEFGTRTFFGWCVAGSFFLFHLFWVCGFLSCVMGFVSFPFFYYF